MQLDDKQDSAQPAPPHAANIHIIGYALPGTANVPSLQKRVGRLSLIVGIFTVVVSALLAAALGAETFAAHRQVVGLPAQIAAINGQNQANAAIEAKRLNDYRSLLARREARAVKRPLTTEEASAIIGIIDARVGALNSAQTLTLRGELQKPGQQLVDPTYPMTDRQTRAATLPTLPLQTILCRENVATNQLSVVISRVYSMTPRDTDTNLLQLDGKGVLTTPPRPTTQETFARLENSIQRPMWAASAWPPAGYADQLRSQQIFFSAGAVTAIANLIFALILLMGGIAAMRAWPRWATYHRIYAGGQTACLISFFLLWIWPRVPLNSGQADGLDAAFEVGLAVNAIASAYPFALIFRLLRMLSSPLERHVAEGAKTPASAVAVSEVLGTGKIFRFELIGVLSIAVGIAGLFINVELSRMFAASLPEASSEVRQADAAMAKEMAAENAEAASEKRERAGPQPRGLTNQEAEAVIQKAESICGAIPDLERKTLTAALVAPGQRWIDPSISVEARSANRSGHLWFDQDRQQTVTAIKWRNPELEFESIHRRSVGDHPTITELHIAPNGDLLLYDIDSPAGKEQSGKYNATQIWLSYWGITPGAGTDAGDARKTLSAGQLGCAATVPAAVMSALLLMAGTLSLWWSTKLATRLHWIYIVAKPLIAMFSVFAFIQALPVFGPQSGPVGPELIGEVACRVIVVALALTGCIYPLFLFIVLIRSRQSEQRREVMEN